MNTVNTVNTVNRKNTVCRPRAGEVSEFVGRVREPEVSRLSLARTSSPSEDNAARDGDLPPVVASKRGRPHPVHGRATVAAPTTATTSPSRWSTTSSSSSSSLPQKDDVAGMCRSTATDLDPPRSASESWPDLEPSQRSASRENDEENPGFQILAKIVHRGSMDRTGTLSFKLTIEFTRV